MINSSPRPEANWMTILLCRGWGCYFYLPLSLAAILWYVITQKKYRKADTGIKWVSVGDSQLPHCRMPSFSFLALALGHDLLKSSCFMTERKLCCSWGPQSLLFWNSQARVLSRIRLGGFGAGSIDVQFAAVEAGFFCVSGISHWPQSLGHHTFQNKRKMLKLLFARPYLKSAYSGRQSYQRWDLIVPKNIQGVCFFCSSLAVVLALP